MLFFIWSYIGFYYINEISENGGSSILLNSKLEIPKTKLSIIGLCWVGVGPGFVVHSKRKFSVSRIELFGSSMLVKHKNCCC